MNLTLVSDDTSDFEREIDSMAERIHACAVAHGFWPPEGRNVGEMIALEHSELSEALEAHRHGNPPSEKLPGFCSHGEELADAVIRIFDHAQGMGINLGRCIEAKVAYNEGRPFKHGKSY